MLLMMHSCPFLYYRFLANTVSPNIALRNKSELINLLSLTYNNVNSLREIRHRIRDQSMPQIKKPLCK